MAEGSVHLVDDDPGVRDALAFLMALCSLGSDWLTP